MGRLSVAAQPEDLPITLWGKLLISRFRVKIGRIHTGHLKKSKFLIAAPSSGSGKTTICLGLMRAISRMGKDVQPFKCGPDYIDTMHHATAANRQSVNLDLFMSSPVHVQEIFDQHFGMADVAIVEGVMGLFDGAERMHGSSAEVAELLDLPIILVVNAKAMAYSAAPLLHGFVSFRPQLRFAGVIFNFVNSASHYEFLKEAALDAGILPLGYIPLNNEIQIGSRHLGLDISADTGYSHIIENAADHIEKHLDIPALLELCKTDHQPKPFVPKPAGKLRIAVAQDEAFNFAYTENLSAMEELGELVFFSPIRDRALPEADLLYLAGGYPELYLQELSDNEAMRAAILKYCEAGGRVWAECGGMMYLCGSIIDKEGSEYPMVGALLQTASMLDMHLHLGYRKVVMGDHEFRGHEFHYSHIEDSAETPVPLQMLTARNREVGAAIFAKRNIRASYVHFYWAHCCREFFHELFKKY